MPFAGIRATNNLHTRRVIRRVGMWVDVVVEETRKIREENAEEFNYDLEAIYRDLKEQEKKSSRKVVSLPAKQPVYVARGCN